MKISGMSEELPKTQTDDKPSVWRFTVVVEGNYAEIYGAKKLVYEALEKIQ